MPERPWWVPEGWNPLRLPRSVEPSPRDLTSAEGLEAPVLSPEQVRMLSVFTRGMRELSPAAVDMLEFPIVPRFEHVPGWMGPGGVGRGDWVGVQFPRWERSVPTPSGWRLPDVTTPSSVASHELAHTAIGRMLGGDPATWWPAAIELRDYAEFEPQFREELFKAHGDIKPLLEAAPPVSAWSGSDEVRTRMAPEDWRYRYTMLKALGEYMASLMEYGGRPVRAPAWPTEVPMTPEIAALLAMRGEPTAP